MDTDGLQAAKEKKGRRARILRDTSAALCAFLIAASFTVAVRCYIPYGFFGYMTPGERLLPFVILAPLAPIAAALFVASNRKARLLFPIPVVTVCLALAATAAAPVLIGSLPWREGLYFSDGLIFFLVPLCVFTVLASLSGKVGKRAVISRISVALCALLMLADAAAVYIAENKIGVLAASASALTLPLLSFAGAALGVGRMFSGGEMRMGDAIYFAALLFNCFSVCSMIPADRLPMLAADASAAGGLYIFADLIMSFIKLHKPNKREGTNQ